ncbi:hypothetical protein BDV10DRAFT_199380 [Aspergillus recurvatus]
MTYNQIPAFHTLSSEDPAICWDFFVQHYGDEEQAARDPKMTWTNPEGQTFIGTGTDAPSGSKQNGIYYPRAATPDGCTMHNAMMTFLPPDEDWEDIANLTGDRSWEPREMRKYFERGHGFDGYLGTSHPDPGLLESMKPFLDAALETAPSKENGSPAEIIHDANAPGTHGREGVVEMVLAITRKGRRSSPRDYLVSTASATNPDGSKKYPQTIRVNSLATKVLFSSGPTPKAAGVEFLDGAGLYEAAPTCDPKTGAETKREFATHEIIIAGGAFNTPQFDIPIAANLPGVGTNLQDNYETHVLARSPRDISVLANPSLGAAGDPFLRHWVTEGTGPFSSAGMSWKVHPRNERVGTVPLESADPRRRPAINFRFFDSRNDREHDLAAMAEGISCAREMFASAEKMLGPQQEENPGPEVKDVGAVKQDITDKAFSHHATSTCAIGADDDPLACLDSNFNVRGVKRLRVVDASVFPRVPGAYPVLPIYMVSEKATDVILNAAKQSPPVRQC